MPYRASKADIAFRDALRGNDRNPIKEARLIRKVSLEYLVAIRGDNMGAHSTLGYLVDTEIARRNALPARYANWISLVSAALALVAIIISLAK